MAPYEPVTQEILAQLEAIAPGRAAGEDVNPDYGRDEMPIYGVHMPEAAVEVLSTKEAAAVVKLCYDHNIPVTTRAPARAWWGPRPSVRRGGAGHHPDEPHPGL